MFLNESKQCFVFMLTVKFFIDKENLKKISICFSHKSDFYHLYITFKYFLSIVIEIPWK